MAAPANIRWIKSKYKSMQDVININKHVFTLTSQAMKYLPSAIRMFKIFQRLYYSKVQVLKYDKDGIYYNITAYNCDAPGEMVMFVFASEAALGDFERDIIREMGIYCDGNPPAYQEYFEPSAPPGKSLD